MTSNQTRTHTRGRILEDVVRETPVDRSVMRARRRALIALLLLVLILAALHFWYHADRGQQDGSEPGQYSTSPVEPRAVRA